MGAGQIGGIATLLDIDFNNAAGFIGTDVDVTEGQYVSMFMSHAMMFCMGTLIEAHVILTAASCVYGERYRFDVIAGTHRFLEFTGVSRTVHHLCIHKGYNHTFRWEQCTADNLALLVLDHQFSFNQKEEGADYIINRARYGASMKNGEKLYEDKTCRYYGYGSRRNGFLIPLLLYMRRVDVIIRPTEDCPQLFNTEHKFFCIQEQPCKSPKFGALCPDDVGSVIVCSGFARGMMVSRLVDRPCGVGFLDLTKYTKFLTCGVDDSRDVINHEIHMDYPYTIKGGEATPGEMYP